MTANKTTTALVVLAVLAALACGSLALTHGAARPAVAQVATQQYTMSDIDRALATGPVFVEFETKECGYCKQQHPVSQSLADAYGGKVTFFFVDAAEDRDLARQFQVSGVPQISVIASKTSSGYTYVDEDGKTSNSLAASRFLGLTDKSKLTTALDAAVRLRGQ